MEHFNDVKNDSYVRNSRSVKRMLTFSCMHASTAEIQWNCINAYYVGCYHIFSITRIHSLFWLVEFWFALGFKLSIFKYFLRKLPLVFHQAYK